MKRPVLAPAIDARARIDLLIRETPDWRGERLAELRGIVREAAPELVESWKWNTPVWSYAGNVCSVAVFRDHVKFSFFHGASLADPAQLFNAALDARATRSIEIRKNDPLDRQALVALVREALARQKNTGAGAPREPAGRA